MELARDGFAIRTGLFTEAECGALLSRLRSVCLPSARARSAGVRHLMRVPEIAAGATAVPFRATYFDKSPAANWLVPWHQDTALPIAASGGAAWGPWSTKEGIRYAHAPAWALERGIALCLHLDASTPENGPLLVLRAATDGA